MPMARHRDDVRMLPEKRFEVSSVQHRGCRRGMQCCEPVSELPLQDRLNHTAARPLGHSARATVSAGNVTED